jgi:hypothetical protein
MIKSDEVAVLEYDAQIEALQVIRAALNTNNIDALQYFVREYVRTSEVPAGFDELKALHGALCDQIEGFEI